MQKYIALLRGINVSGQKIIPMTDLRTALSNAGLESVQTYIQSGNIVFESADSDMQLLSAKIHAVIEADFGFDVPVLVFPQEDILKIPELNLWFKKGEDTKSLYVGFLFDQPTNENLATLKGCDTGRDEYLYVSPYIFMKYAEGIGKSKMDNNFFEKVLKVKMSTRNWNTIRKLGEI